MAVGTNQAPVVLRGSPCFFFREGTCHVDTPSISLHIPEKEWYTGLNGGTHVFFLRLCFSLGVIINVQHFFQTSTKQVYMIVINLTVG